MTIKSVMFDQLLSNSVFSLEEVIFLFTEIRKLAEVSKMDLPSVKFYCDWLLHSQKDRITSEMKNAFEKMYIEIVFVLDNPIRQGIKKDINNFIYFSQLRKELSILLTSNNLLEQITKNNDIWLDLIRFLVKLLEEQPINKPISKIVSFEYISSNTGVVIGQFNFLTPYKIGYQAYSYYRISNYY